MSHSTIFAPAKLNLFLAITGRRPDGFHNLVSVVAPLEFGDTLDAELIDGEGEQQFTLACSDPDVPRDPTNLVLKAAVEFAKATGWTRRVRFTLEKRIPVGAGLGGGSSNAVAALRALNGLAGEPLEKQALAAIAATLGSDCPLFLENAPVVMRGRGERVEPLPPAAAARLRGRRVLVFKPQFGIPTAWAYRRLAETAAQEPREGGSAYLVEALAERRLADWIADASASPEALTFNNMERAAFEKYIAIPTLLDDLRSHFGLLARMTGSGSACFAFLQDDTPVEAISARIRGAWGDAAFVVVTRVA